MKLVAVAAAAVAAAVEAFAALKFTDNAFVLMLRRQLEQAFKQAPREVSPRVWGLGFRA